MRVAFSARALKFPPVCSCCGDASNAAFVAKATRTTGKRVVHHRTHSWEIPWCGVCSAHADLASTAVMVFALIAMAAIVVGIVIWLSAAHAAGIALGIAIGGVAGGLPILMILNARAERRRKPTCSTVGSPVEFLGWDGSVQFFDCRSERFAAAFAIANQTKLINVSPELRQLLTRVAEAAESARKVRTHEEETAAPALELRPPPARNESLIMWLEKIERLKGTAARRAAFGRALVEITSSEDRATLALEVSRMDVRTALDKADSLKTAAAKRRALVEALERIRADDVPDELQAPEIAMLEDAIRRLDAPAPG